MNKFDVNEMEWISMPQRYLFNNERIVLETQPYQELSREIGDQGAAGLALNPKGNFCFTVRVDFDYQGLFDQCGIILYKGETRKAVCCTKHHTDTVDDLDCIVFHNEFGDRSLRQIGTAIRWMYYRVWYRSSAVRIQYSFNGTVYSDLRQFRLEEDNEPVRIGIYACSPNDSSFDCTFSEMELNRDKE